MLGTVLSVILIFGAIVLAVAVGSVTLLALGTGLALVFAVTVFEATVVATAVALVLLVLIVATRPHSVLEEIAEEVEHAEDSTFDPWSLRTQRGKRRRR